MNKTIIAFSGAGAVGLIVFLLIQFSNVSINKDGVSVEMGGSPVAAGCFEDGPSCLPPLDMVDVDGKVWTPESLQGKVVLINFWATWCAPCKHEIPDLAKVYRKYKGKGFVMLGLMSDKPASAQLKAFMTKFSVDYPVVRMTPELRQAFGYPNALPTNFVYSRSGHLVFDRPGAISAGELEREIKNLL